MKKRASHTRRKKKRSHRGGRLDGSRIRGLVNVIKKNQGAIKAGLQKTRAVSRGLQALGGIKQLGFAAPALAKAANFASQRGYGFSLGTRSGSGIMTGRGRKMRGMRHVLV